MRELFPTPHRGLDVCGESLASLLSTHYPDDDDEDTPEVPTYDAYCNEQAEASYTTVTYEGPGVFVVALFCVIVQVPLAPAPS